MCAGGVQMVSEVVVEGLYTQQHTQYPLSPVYEDVSPVLETVVPQEGDGYYGYATTGEYGLQGDMGMGYFGGQQEEGYAYEVKVEGYAEQGFQVQGGEWEQHLSPVSEAQSLDL